MKRLDRRKFMLLASVGTTGAVLTACGNDPDDVDLNPTMIPDAEGAPPTLAPQATPGGGATAPEEEAPADEGGGDVVTLEAQDPYAWSATELEAAPGQVIQVTNAGMLEHNIVVEEWGVEEDLPPGEPVDITVPDDAAVGDTFVYYCSVPGHREGGMEGNLTIVEAGAAAPAGEPAAEGGASPEATPDEAAAAAPAEGGGEPIVLEADDPFAWSVNEIEASPGQVIEVTNVGFLEHNFTVDELEIAEDLPPGEPVEITIPDDATAGDTFEYYCSVAGHREGGMVGNLTIV